MPNQRIRLTAEELDIINHRRKEGVVPPGEMVQYDQKITSLSLKYRTLQKKYKHALNLIETKDTFLEAMWAKESEGRHKLLDIQPKHAHIKKNSESYAFAIASDWHTGEMVDPKTVNDLNSFNLEICQARAKLFFQRALYLTDLVRAGTDIPVFVLALLGDFICGEIRDEIREEALGSATEMISMVIDLLGDGIDFLLKEGKFEHIFIPCCYGNHGRNTPEIRSSTAWKKSYEYLMYSFLERIYKNNSKVTFQISRGYHNYFTIYNKYKFRLHHGDAIRYAGGIGGISIPVNKAVSQWNKSPAGRNTYLDIFGHYHQSKSDAWWISNGSLVGYNAYALKLKADFEPPRQQFFTVEKKFGLTFPSYIFLE